MGHPTPRLKLDVCYSCPRQARQKQFESRWGGANAGGATVEAPYEVWEEVSTGGEVWAPHQNFFLSFRLKMVHFDAVGALL